MTRMICLALLASLTTACMTDDFDSDDDGSLESVSAAVNYPYGGDCNTSCARIGRHPLPSVFAGFALDATPPLSRNPAGMQIDSFMAANGEVLTPYVVDEALIGWRFRMASSLIGGGIEIPAPKLFSYQGHDLVGAKLMLSIENEAKTVITPFSLEIRSFALQQLSASSTDLTPTYDLWVRREGETPSASERVCASLPHDNGTVDRAAVVSLRGDNVLIGCRDLLSRR
jgi:hypothetical protein